MYPGFIVLFACCCSRCSCCLALNVHKLCFCQPVSLPLPYAVWHAACQSCARFRLVLKPAKRRTCVYATHSPYTYLYVCVWAPRAAFLQFTAWKRRRLSDIIMLQRRLLPHGRRMHFRPRLLPPDPHLPTSSCNNNSSYLVSMTTRLTYSTLNTLSFASSLTLELIELRRKNVFLILMELFLIVI